LYVIAAAVGELEACKLQHLATIEDLQKDLVAVKQRSVELEQSRLTLESDQRLKSTEQDLRIQSLQNVNCLVVLAISQSICYCNTFSLNRNNM